MIAGSIAVAIPAARAETQGSTAQSRDGSTFEMVECLKAKGAEWDKRMNAAYQQALKDAADGPREQLRTAQRLWIQYHDANCLYYDLGEGPSPGSTPANACTA
ncbi:DUF1311 domain-containing protein [Bradyrhizobium sp. ISRA443]|uniref:lysozyme inhibitor LprI family protein n=1 Tax=unclassified Bradyrhizobium TaxID=2631580 RepID=UPI00247A6BA2|nr:MULTISPECIES: lysozyme inhibitor LprI family protein [unclassified Bradyrhizobium]WGS01043.1 DUF1311 domain-containing protein [Bradyrhizobium sp. ISRA436]WGS07930.1 DUF1311 domain-containing protein [Bradyrhizobium sp. ISRA437]WGS14818.1 DUF1311 domain-containing protein [Bradyrhizobium sp. ISRA443]